MKETHDSGSDSDGAQSTEVSTFSTSTSAERQHSAPVHPHTAVERQATAPDPFTSTPAPATSADSLTADKARDASTATSDTHAAAAMDVDPLIAAPLDDNTLTTSSTAATSARNGGGIAPSGDASAGSTTMQDAINAPNGTCLFRFILIQR